MCSAFAAEATLNCVHDYALYAWSVDWSQRRLTLHTECEWMPVQLVDVSFQGLIAFGFRDDQQPAILTDIDSIEVAQLLCDEAAEFELRQRASLPYGAEYKGLDGLLADLTGRQARAFQLTSAIGLDGWVLASGAELHSRTRRWSDDA